MKKIIAANWKLNKSPAQAREFFSQFPKQTSDRVSAIVFPSAICLEAVAQVAQGKNIQFGLQNAYSENSGAFTGENSMSVLKELGGSTVLLGHSERRTLFQETDELIFKKVQAAHANGLVPMVCIGETLDERESKRTFRVLETQIENGLVDYRGPLVIAYEPVWAIGTGRVATEEQVAEAHEFIHGRLQERGFQNTPLLYGGSVKVDHSTKLLKIAHVGGFLVGGASLDPASFLALIQSAESLSQ